MQPIIVMPMHDPAGLIFPHLIATTPHLKSVFARAFVSITTSTREAQSKYLAWLEQDDFFQPLYHQTEVQAGDDFLALYTYAVAACSPNQILHLGFSDRVVFALQNQYRAQFMADIQAIKPEDTPLMFLRSKLAWDTHPANYYELEQMVTRVGQLLFKKSLDFAWCYLALQAQQLQAILPTISNHDVSMVAEIALALKDRVQTKEVDWLAWEDPFLYASPPPQLKAEREASRQETWKRLAYVIPMLQLLKETIEE